MSPPDGIDTPPATPPAAPPATPPATPPAAAAPPGDPPAAPPATPPAAAAPKTPDNLPVWRDDWRVAMAKGDDKELKLLGRYASPEAVYDAYRAARLKIDGGQIKTPLPENATPEQLAEYRKENGIPETADKYDLTLGNGLVVGEADKPLADSFLKAAHANNWNNTQVKQGLEWYYGQQDAQRLAQEERDATDKNDGQIKVGEEWKGQSKGNLKLISDFMKEAPGDVADNILAARLPNGKLLGNDFSALSWILDQARFKNPVPSSIGGTSEAQVKTAQTRLGDLVKLSGDRTSEYWKGPKAAAMQEEHLQLIDGLEQLKARSGGRRPA